MIILGIETSCDETAASIVQGERGRVEVLSNIVSSQIDIHKKYGGVVPEVAAREHVLNILPVINEALFELTKNNSRRTKKNNIDAIAVTVGPGLITSLIVGVETAKTLSYAWNIPVVAINHIEGHIYANFIRQKSENSGGKTAAGKNSKFQIPKIQFPALILTVSGGHTMLVLMKDHAKYATIGETRDDAAGEAFDKAAQLLGLGYPGGPAVAEKASPSKFQIPNRQSKISLPRPMINKNNFDFSFSGLKTALLYQVQKDPLRLAEGETGKKWKNKISDYCAEFQQAVIDVLIAKTMKAAEKFHVRTIMLAGGVAANLELRLQLEKTMQKKLSAVNFIMPDLKYCTDNAAMVATAGYFRALKRNFKPWQKLKVDCNLELK